MAGIYFDREARIVYLPFSPSGEGDTLYSRETDWGLIDLDRAGRPCGGEESTNRLAKEKGESIPTSFSILHFEVPSKQAK